MGDQPRARRGTAVDRRPECPGPDSIRQRHAGSGAMGSAFGHLVPCSEMTRKESEGRSITTRASVPLRRWTAANSSAGQLPRG